MGRHSKCKLSKKRWSLSTISQCTLLYNNFLIAYLLNNGNGWQNFLLILSVGTISCQRINCCFWSWIKPTEILYRCIFFWRSFNRLYWRSYDKGIKWEKSYWQVFKYFVISCLGLPKLTLFYFFQSFCMWSRSKSSKKIHKTCI